MAVIWTEQAADERVQLLREFDAKNLEAADKQDDAIAQLAGSLDRVAIYQQLQDGTHVVPVKGYPVVILYDRNPATSDALVLNLAHSRSNWKCTP